MLRRFSSPEFCQHDGMIALEEESYFISVHDGAGGCHQEQYAMVAVSLSFIVA